MTQTLKEHHALHKINKLRENIKKIDQQVLQEHRLTTLIVEAMDENDLKQASNVIDKLRTLQGKDIGSLDAAIDKAIAEINKYTGGGPLTKAWTKIKGKFGVDNPLVKIMTFANALEMGFKQIPTIIKNNVGEVKPEMVDKTLLDVITDEKAKNVATQNILKALSPSGLFGAFKKVPYVDDMKVLVQDLMTTPLKNLNAVIKQGVSGAQTSDIAQDLKGQIQGQGSVETKGTQPGETTKPAEQPTAGTPTKGSVSASGTVSTGEQSPQQGGTETDELKIAGEVASDNLKAKTVLAVVRALRGKGYKINK
jgi:hypothetical protein